jgi:hypothetical protein
MNILHVKAAPGLKLPKEGSPRAYITDAEPVPVQASRYYRKALADGDLVEATPSADVAETPAIDHAA